MRPPDLHGRAGRAWALSLEEKYRERAGQVASIAGYLVNCPGQHPAWAWWLVACVHLRPIPGAPPAILQYPGAEHEFMILTIDPGAHPEPNPDAPGWHTLRPADACVQFSGVGDEKAAELCRLAVRAMVDGHASPDSDYRSWWNQAIVQTAQHLAMGGHPQAMG